MRGEELITYPTGTLSLEDRVIGHRPPATYDYVWLKGGEGAKLHVQSAKRIGNEYTLVRWDGDEHKVFPSDHFGLEVCISVG